MGECITPMTNREPLNRTSEERVLEDTAAGSYMMHCQQSSFNYLAPMSTHDVAELTWENGQLALHELSGMLPLSTSSPRPPTWERTEDTLESIVQQATATHRKLASTTNLSGNNSNHIHIHHKDVKNECSVAGAAGKYWGKTGSSNGQAGFPLQPSSSSMMSMSMPVNKRMRIDHSDDQTNNQSGRRNSLSFSEEEYWADQGGACASASAAFCGENSNNRNNNDTSTTMMTWASLESPRSTMRTKPTDEDSVCDHGESENQGGRGTKGETATGRSSSARRGRAAAIHNQSERRRRDRINQKMKALQKLVPNANKTDKASMLDEVIEYLKQLQAQVQMMASARTISHLMMPLEMQHQLQMSILARMGMGVGLGMGMGILDVDKVNAPATTNAATMPPQQPLAPLLHPSFQLATNASSTFSPSSFVAPSMIPPSQLNNEDVRNSIASSLHNPYNAFLAQSMKMEMFNRMSGLYRQQMHQSMGVPLQSKSLQQI